jgi:hypothetical protein
MYPRAYPVQLLHDETPPSGCLQGHLELRTIKARQELAHALAMRRSDPRAGDFARHRVDPLRSDLRSVLVESQYDCHPGPPQAPWFEHLRGLSALELRRSLLMPSLRKCDFGSGRRSQRRESRRVAGRGVPPSLCLPFAWVRQSALFAHSSATLSCHFVQRGGLGSCQARLSSLTPRWLH